MVDLFPLRSTVWSAVPPPIVVVIFRFARGPSIKLCPIPALKRRASFNLPDFFCCCSCSVWIAASSFQRAVRCTFDLRNIIMRASHILVKHQGSRRTASWKDQDGVQIKTRTKVRCTWYMRCALYSTLFPFPRSDINSLLGARRTRTQIQQAKSPTPCSLLLYLIMSENPRHTAIDRSDLWLFHRALYVPVPAVDREEDRAKKLSSGMSLLQRISFPEQRNRRRPADTAVSLAAVLSRQSSAGPSWTHVLVAFFFFFDDG